MDRLVLEIPWFESSSRWHWRLTDEDRAYIEFHEVTLDPASAEYKAFTRLDKYVVNKADPKRFLASQVELIEWVGRWIGDEVFGPVGPAILERTPATVMVRVPPGADLLLFRPLELGYVDGSPLALQDVSLVLVPPDKPKVERKSPVGDRLRILAVFSVPSDEELLVLRQQRFALAKLINRIAARHTKAIDLEVLQYGATQDRLRSHLEDGLGWDIVHFSGHGLAAGLVLERPDGTRDRVESPQLLGLLRPGRARLKLLSLSSCESAAATVSELARLRRREGPDVAAAAAEDRPDSELPALAREAVRQLGCAVLASRYKVGDDFSIALADNLYEYLIGKRQPLPRALQLALPKALGDRPDTGVPPLSVAVPTLFGAPAVDLVLEAPAVTTQDYSVTGLKMAWFPDEPEVFVGRSGTMTVISETLAGEAHSAVVLEGPAHIGKSACALELAYRQQHNFGTLVWYEGPGVTEGVSGALRMLGERLDTQLPRLQMSEALVDQRHFKNFLLSLRQLLEERSILLVLDGLDVLLADGRWRDPWWGELLEALVGHGGESRTVLTARVRPRDLDERARVLSLDVLSPQESVALARQLPQLGAIMRSRTGLDRDQAITVLARTLTAAAGNPGSIRKADRELAQPGALPDRVARLEEDGPEPDEERYRPLLKNWMLAYDQP